MLQIFHHPPSPHTILENPSKPAIPVCQRGQESTNTEPSKAQGSFSGEMDGFVACDTVTGQGHHRDLRE